MLRANAGAPSQEIAFLGALGAAGGLAFEEVGVLRFEQFGRVPFIVAGEPFEAFAEFGGEVGRVEAGDRGAEELGWWLKIDCADRDVAADLDIAFVTGADRADGGGAGCRDEGGGGGASVFDEAGHEFVGQDRGIAEDGRGVVAQVAVAVSALEPAPPDINAAINFRIAVLCVDAIDGAMAEVPEMVEHALDAVIREQANRGQAGGCEVAIEDDDFVFSEVFQEARGDDGAVGNDEGALGLGNDIDEDLFIPMHELAGAERKAAARGGFGNEDAKLREVARGVGRIEQADFGRVQSLRVIGVDFERARGLADEDFLFEQLENGAAGRHVADAGFLGEAAFAGDAIDEVIAFADPLFDDGHHLVVFAGGGHFCSGSGRLAKVGGRRSVCSKDWGLI